MEPGEDPYNELAYLSPTNAKPLQSGWPLCCVSSRCRSKIERRYVGLRSATGELVAKKTQQPDERSEPILDLLNVKQISLLPYGSLPVDLSDLNSELTSLGLYPHRLLIRFKGGFVPNWLLLLDSDNMDYWHMGLLIYVKKLEELPSEGLIELQFYTEFSLQPEEMDPAWNLSVSEKEIRDWLAGNMNAAFKPSRLTKLLDEYLPSCRRSQGSFETFARTLQLCLWSSQHFTSKVTAFDLEQFAWQCQGEQPDSIAKLQASSGITFGCDGSIIFSAFLDMLFCKANSVTDESRTQRVYHNMDLPLSAYFISTSHNTYLTGDQLRSDSSVQCYVSALRQGCRCVELDLWDGPKDTPVIYHGHTLTSKIDLEPVLLAIREHAFKRTETPLILSLEDHCSLQQQARTADLLIKVFGQNLLTAPVASAQGHYRQQLPSPSELKYRVLIKHDKLKSSLKISTPNNPTVTAAVAAAAAAAATSSGISAASTNQAADAPPVHTGRVQVQNPVSNTWEPYVAVLTESDLLFMSDECSTSQATSARASFVSNRTAEDDLSGLKFCVWFHDNIDRSEAESRIRRWCNGDSEGRFLVRPSPTNPGDFSLSFMNRGVINHCHIRKTPDPQNPTRWLFSIPNVKSPSGSSEVQLFARMIDLVDYYKACGIDQRSWYLGEISKKSAEDLLCQVPYSGGFLVRKKSGDCVDGEFVLAFRSEREIKRCIISCRAGKAMIGNFPECNSLAQLIDQFSEQPIYRNIRLRYPVNEASVEKIARTGVCNSENRAICESDYHGLILLGEGADESLLDDKPDAAMRITAAYNSKASDELSVKRGDILVNVSRISPDWWLGTLESSGSRGLVPAAVLEPCNTGEYVEMSIPVRGINRVQIPPADRQQQQQSRHSLCVEFHASGGNAPGSYNGSHQLVMRAPTQDELLEWVQQIESQRRRHFGRAVVDTGSMRRERIAPQLSDLVVYCVPTRSPEQKIRFRPSQYYEMVSVSESRMPKNLECQLASDIKDFTLNQLVRVYPRTTRFKSSNFNPMLAWELGCQMVALNWQTSDRAMLFNRALFADNGGCGYVLKPEFYQQQTSESSRVDVRLRVLAGRRLPRTSPQITSSYVEVELYKTRSRSAVVPDNGLNPVYKDCNLEVKDCPEDSILRISVATETEAWQDRVVIGEFAQPIRTLRSGYRSVALCDEFGDEIPASSLLVHLVISR
uniref:Phosphoinositide phospholipase C n=1 Tax=Macrostomum lignano TaxID=282301 RepID=A0A1I8HI18_9PLAT